MSKIEQSTQEYPIGTKVKYYPIKGNPEFEQTVIRSEPWQLAHGEIVIKVKGRAGGVCLSHIEKLC